MTNEKEPTKLQKGLTRLGRKLAPERWLKDADDTLMIWKRETPAADPVRVKLDTPHALVIGYEIHGRSRGGVNYRVTNFGVTAEPYAEVRARMEPEFLGEEDAFHEHVLKALNLILLPS